MARKPTKEKRTFGNVRKLPSGRFQARYTGPDGRTYSAQDAAGRSLTFETRTDGDVWLSLRHSEITREKWKPNAATPLTVREFADAWLAERDLGILTRELYAALLRNHIFPSFDDTPLPELTAAKVRTWHARLKTGKTAKAHAYALLRTVLNTAVDDELIAANPCRIHGAGQAKRAIDTEPATVDELVIMVEAMPSKYQLAVLLAAWCGPRFGELAELRRKDVDLRELDEDNRGGWLRIRRSVVWCSAGGRVIKEPKTAGSRRVVSIPPHVVPAIVAHIDEHAAPGDEGLLFPGADGVKHMCESSLRVHWWRARKAAGRPDLRFHDLRHTSATLAASMGAPLKDLMNRLGHTTFAAALRYQHKAQKQDQAIADGLSAIATANNVVALAAAKRGVQKKKRSA